MFIGYFCLGTSFFLLFPLKLNERAINIPWNGVKQYIGAHVLKESRGILESFM